MLRSLSRSFLYVPSSKSLRQLSSKGISPLAMPSLSPTMTAGTIASWKKQPGDNLVAGDVLCEIETDKASVGFEVQDEGVLAKILVPAQGPELACGQPIALIAEDQEAYKSFLAAGEPIPLSTVPATTVAAPAPTQSILSTVLTTSTSNSALLSPAARHLIESKGLSLHGVNGTAKGGRITKADVIKALRSGYTRPEPTNIAASTSAISAAVITETVTSAVAPILTIIPTFTAQQFTASSIPVNNNYTDIPNSTMRKVIAKRLTESKKSVPHFYTSIECEIDELMRLRARLKKDFDVSVSVNDLVIKSAAHALRDLPLISRRWSSNSQFPTDPDGQVDISVAVATPNGLITPIVTGADRRGVADVGSKVRDLAGRAREGKLKPEEFQGGCFSISNLGMFSIGSFSAVINPPQACILAVGAGVTRVLPPLSTTDNSARPRVATVVTVQLSSDRRVVSETQAAEFLQVFRQYLSQPQQLLL